MARKKPQHKSTGSQPIKSFIRKRSPAQWRKLKVWLRTGEAPPGLRRDTITAFARLGIKYKEEASQRLRRPYHGQFSEKEQTEIRRQMKDLVELIMPRETDKAALVKGLCQVINPIQRKHVLAEIKQMEGGEPGAADIFKVSRMYLDALDPANRAKAKRKGLKRRWLGFSDKGKAFLTKNWTLKKYNRTLPFHEAMHLFVGLSEYKVSLAEFYYSLKTGIMNESYLKRYQLIAPQARMARKRAIALFQHGKAKGWQHADKQLRKEVLPDGLI